jgi:hypothetical protein
MRNCLKITPVLLLSLLIVGLLGTNAPGSIFSDPNVPNGEKYIWRGTMPDQEPIVSTVTWTVRSGEGRPMYEITTDAGERKKGIYILDKSDLRLISTHVIEQTADGKFELDITVKNGRQYMVSEFKNKTKDKDIEHPADGYNGVTMPFYLRGFPFGKKNEVNPQITVPVLPDKPLWVWKMWSSNVKFMGEERVTVPAGTFDCYKLEVSAGSWVIRRLTSKYYFWYTKEPPHRFVKFQDEEGENRTELMEILSTGIE